MTPTETPKLARDAMASSAAAHGSADGPNWEEVIIAQVLAHLDALPEDWGNYSPHWRCGYDQARNKVAALLKARRSNERADR